MCCLPNIPDKKISSSGRQLQADPTPDLQSIIGMFVGTLALRNQAEGKLPFAEFLAQVKMNMLHIYENQDYPFEALVEQVMCAET